MVVSATTHVLRHRRLTHDDAEFSQLTMDPRRTHRGLAFAMLRISAGTSGGTLGRPVRRRLFQVQKSLKSRRCHATTVAGCTRTIARRQSLHIHESQTQSRRSVTVRRT